MIIFIVSVKLTDGERRTLKKEGERKITAMKVQ
jgi:hypothetical protein